MTTLMHILGGLFGVSILVGHVVVFVRGWRYKGRGSLGRRRRQR
jgi:hypothetical protein